jgi:predicted transcriptional regulator
MASGPETWVFSLHPEQAGRIHAGLKTNEFRRGRVRVPPGSRVLMYETAPVGRVTGHFTVGEVHHGTPDEVLAREPNADSRRGAAPYLEGAESASGLEVVDVVRYDRPRTLREATGMSRPPQRYARVRPDSA